MAAVQVGATTVLKEVPGVCFTWRVTGVRADWFTGSANGLAGVVRSPTFSAYGKDLQLVLYPNGDTAAAVGHVSVFVHLVSPDVQQFKPATVKVTLSSKSFTMIERSFSTTKPPPAETSATWSPTWGWQKTATHAEVLEAPDAFFPGGVLSVTVELSSAKLEPENTAAVEALGAAIVAVPASCLASDFAGLLGSGEGADVTLLCGTDRIKAHSLILCARSPVFKAQLAGELACSLDAVPVPDEIDAPTLRRTLSFIYTDECEPTSAEEAQHLLNSADHYGLVRLRAICERKLVETLSIENVAYSLTLAEQHSAPTLKDAALRFLAKHAVAVVKTEGWAHLLSAMPALAGEAMHTLATGVPPEPLAGDEGEEDGRRVRRRTA